MTGKVNERAKSLLNSNQVVAGSKQLIDLPFRLKGRFVPHIRLWFESDIIWSACWSYKIKPEFSYWMKFAEEIGP